MSFELLPSAKSVSRHLGMGPIPHADGVAFRVWAPHAERVSLIGSFNDWDPSAAEMTPEAGGLWYHDCPDAQVGDHYKYRIEGGGRSFDRIDPRVREVTNSVGEGVVHNPDFDWQDDHFEMPPWNELVVYEMHVGTFRRREDDSPGQFADVLGGLDHLRSLGINAIQIMPAAEFAGDISWGYNPAHVFAVESAYGGPGEFKRFVREAHARGFAVILDVVYNHFGPSDLDLWQFDGWSQNDKGGIYFYNDHRSTTPWGDTRPDYGRGEVRSFIRDNAMMWLQDYHVDGLRYDMTLYIRSVDGSTDIPDGWGLTQWINREVHAFKASALTIAEDLQNNSYLTKSDGEGGAGFSTQWDAGFVHPIRDVITTPRDQDRDMEKVRGALLHRYNGDPFQRVVYTESHDEVANGKSRVPSEIDENDPEGWFAKKRTALGVVLTLTAPGIPMLFQGQEFLQPGWFQDTEELEWENAEQLQGFVRLHRELIDLRRNLGGHSRGLTGAEIDVYHVNHADKVVAYVRRHGEYPEGDVLVVLNFANRRLDGYRIGVPAEGTWKRRFSSDSGRFSEDFDSAASGDLVSEPQGHDGQPRSGVVNLPPYTALIFSRDFGGERG